MTVSLGLVQMQIGTNVSENVTKAEALVREAAAKGAKIILLPELFENYYFCQLEREEYFSWANPVEGHPFLTRFQKLAAELQVVLPVSFFETAGQAYYNSLMMVDADGKALGVYRKSHIPDGPGYEEKYYFNSGDSGFKTWSTRYGKIGVGICWDQWFPECARIMALKGADLLLYPTAIGSEPAAEVETPNTPDMWQRAMIGHAVSNSCYVGASNRIGKETFESSSCDFYGHSFLSDYRGDKLVEEKADFEGVLVAPIDLEAARKFRAGMGFFRDRRPELYKALLTLDGNG
ncbi:MAG: N-carbamoylputrescine amidase [Proteobacteria bacterium]|nr:MAG: N-carbamoylputrescine amidase [Pseudomonadota bacterium]